MPKRAIGAILATAIALVLLFSYKTPADQAAALGAPAPASQRPIAEGSPGPGSTPAASTPGPASTGGPAGSGAFTGDAVEEPFGVIQVQATIVAGKLTAVTVVQMPSRGRSGFISADAAPILEGEAISAQSASIDSVSGATYTSEAYAKSLQSALDQARG